MMGAPTREAHLDKEIDRYLKKGYRVTNRAPFEAQMVRPRQTHKLASTVLAILTLGLSLIIEMILFATNAGGERAIHLRVDNGGKVRVLKTKA